MTLDLTLLEPSGPNIQTRIYIHLRQEEKNKKDVFLQ